MPSVEIAHMLQIVLEYWPSVNMSQYRQATRGGRLLIKCYNRGAGREGDVIRQLTSDARLSLKLAFLEF